MNCNTCPRLAAIAALSLLFCCVPPLRADDFVGEGVAVVVGPLGETPIEGYRVYKDAQGSYYASKGQCCEADYHSVKPQPGDKIKYKDNEGVE
jgi:hypothetical protein